MRRREFLAALGSATAASSPFAARAQERMRRIGVLLPAAADDPQFQPWLGGFLQELAKLGWSIGRNVRIDTRWATANAAEIRQHAADLAALAPDVIVAHGASSVVAMLQVTSAVPIVFPVAVDPVGAGIVNSLARPGGNATGFSEFEYSLGGKWLELLKQIAPDMTRVAVLRDPANPGGPAMSASSRPWHRRSRWSSARSTCVTSAKSNARSRHSRAPRWRPDCGGVRLRWFIAI